MTIKQQGGIFGRNPTLNEVNIEGELKVDSDFLVGQDAVSVSNSGVFAEPEGSIGAIRSSNISAYFGRNTTDGNIVRILRDGVSVGAISSKAGALLIESTDCGLWFHNSGSFVIPTDGSTGGTSGVMDLGQSGNRFKDIYLGGNVVVANGKGIDFSATAGTGTSELFDDYEEGTWTPVPADAETGGNTGTAGTANGYYTKVGNVVHVMGVLVNINTSGLTAGNLFYIQGLPFASKDLAFTTAYYLSGGVLTSLVTITGNVQMYLGDLSKTTVGFYDAVGNILVSDLTSGAADFYFSLTYMAT